MTIGAIIWVAIALATAVIGFHIHHSVFWSIIDFFFSPFAWLKWMICQEVTVSVIKESFVWFFK